MSSSSKTCSDSISNNYNNSPSYTSMSTPPSVDESCSNFNSIPTAESRLDQTLYQLQRELNFKIFETKDMTEKRRNIISEVTKLTTKWIRQCLKNHVDDEMSEEDIHRSSCCIFPFGSYELNAHFESSDIDLLCVGPKQISRDLLFTEFVKILDLDDRITDILQLRHTFVPLLKFTIDGIDIDLVYVPWNVKIIDETTKINVFSSNYIRDQYTLYCLNGVRSTQTIKRLIPNKCVFEKTLRIIKFWARQRLIYSNVMGYLGGISWSIMTALICIRNPNANCVEIIKQFFDTYNEDNPQSICIDSDLYDDFYDDQNDDDSFNDYQRNEFAEIMPILTPARPAINCAYNVISSTRDVIRREIRRGYQLTYKLSINPDMMDDKDDVFNIDWHKLFEKKGLIYDQYGDEEGQRQQQEEPPHFDHHHGETVYIHIQCIPDSFGKYAKKWSGFIESKLRNLVKKLNRETPFDDSIITFYPFATCIEHENHANFFIVGNYDMDCTNTMDFNVNEFIENSLDQFQNQISNSSVRYETEFKCDIYCAIYNEDQKNKVLKQLHPQQQQQQQQQPMPPPPPPHTSLNPNIGYNFILQTQYNNFSHFPSQPHSHNVGPQQPPPPHQNTNNNHHHPHSHPHSQHHGHHHHHHHHRYNNRFKRRYQSAHNHGNNNNNHRHRPRSNHYQHRYPRNNSNNHHYHCPPRLEPRQQPHFPNLSAFQMDQDYHNVNHINNNNYNHNRNHMNSINPFNSTAMESVVESHAPSVMNHKSDLNKIMNGENNIVHNNNNKNHDNKHDNDNQTNINLQQSLDDNNESVENGGNSSSSNDSSSVSDHIENKPQQKSSSPSSGNINNNNNHQIPSSHANIMPFPSGLPIIQIQPQSFPHLPPFVSTHNGQTTNYPLMSNQNINNGQSTNHNNNNNGNGHNNNNQSGWVHKMITNATSPLPLPPQNEKENINPNKIEHLNIPKGHFIPHKRVKIPDAFMNDLSDNGNVQTEQFGYPCNSNTKTAVSAKQPKDPKSTLVVHPVFNNMNNPLQTLSLSSLSLSSTSPSSEPPKGSDTNSELLRSYQAYCNILNVFNLHDAKNPERSNNINETNANMAYSSSSLNSLSNTRVSPSPPPPPPPLQSTSVNTVNTANIVNDKNDLNHINNNNNNVHSELVSTENNGNSDAKNNNKCKKSTKKPLYSVITAAAPPPPTQNNNISNSYNTNTNSNNYNNNNNNNNCNHNGSRRIRTRAYHNNNHNHGHGHGHNHNRNYDKHEIVAPAPFSSARFVVKKNYHNKYSNNNNTNSSNNSNDKRKHYLQRTRLRSSNFNNNF